LYLEIGSDLAAAELDKFSHRVPGFKMPQTSSGIEMAVKTDGGFLSNVFREFEWQFRRIISIAFR
jgi:hypothetical protein